VYVLQHNDVMILKKKKKKKKKKKEEEEISGYTTHNARVYDHQNMCLPVNKCIAARPSWGDDICLKVESFIYTFSFLFPWTREQEP
jgi:hypothetical protein